ncbi:hypothetical protein G6F63_013464 [Rhizopus arrhizus]|nr:hypothetical protein G6F63_013464 [Rhizopus arrhizus]
MHGLAQALGPRNREQAQAQRALHDRGDAAVAAGAIDQGRPQDRPRHAQALGLLDEALFAPLQHRHHVLLVGLGRILLAQHAPRAGGDDPWSRRAGLPRQPLRQPFQRPETGNRLPLGRRHAVQRAGQIPAQPVHSVLRRLRPPAHRLHLAVHLQQARQQEPADLAGGSGNKDGHRHSMGGQRGLATITTPPATAGSGRGHTDIAKALPQLLILAAGRARTELGGLLQGAFGEGDITIAQAFAAARKPALPAGRRRRPAPGSAAGCHRSRHGWRAAGERRPLSPGNRAAPGPALHAARRTRCVPVD